MKLPAGSYSHSVLSDNALLVHTLGSDLYAAGVQAELVAASWHEQLNIVAMICYLEDPDFPQVKILNCKTGEIFDLDCTDLIDSPFITGITLLETPGKVELQFSGEDDRRTVFYSLENRTISW